MNTNPNVVLTIEGLSMTGELALAADQASAIGAALQKQFTIEPERIVTLGKDGNFKEGINLNIHPDYNLFYLIVKKSMSGSN